MVNWVEFSNPLEFGTACGQSTSFNDAGTIVAIGAPGATNGANGQVNIYQYISDTWTSVVTINGTSGCNFGHVVSLTKDGTFLAVGEPDYSNVSKGKVYIYRYMGGNWNTTPFAIFVGENNGDNFGYSVSLSKNGSNLILAVGANSYNNGAGKVYICQYDGTQWIAPSVGFIGTNSDQLGWSVSLNADGTSLAIGAYGYITTGRVYVYRYSRGSWSLIGQFNGELSGGDSLGFSVDIVGYGSSTVAVVSDPYYNSGLGRVYICKYAGSGTSWTIIGTFTGTTINGYLGWSVSLNGDGTIVGIGETGTNSVYVYQYSVSNMVWNLVDIITGEINDILFGNSISLNSTGDIVIVGAPFTNNYSGLTRLYYQYILPCLTEWTTVLTPNGYVLISSLKVGDMVITCDGRRVPIVNLFKSVHDGSSRTYPYVIPKNSIGDNYPPKKVEVSRSHLIKYGDKWIHPKNSKCFKQNRKLDKVKYYHIELPDYVTDNLVINRGCVVESLGKTEHREEYLKRKANQFTDYRL